MTVALSARPSSRHLAAAQSTISIHQVLMLRLASARRTLALACAPLAASLITTDSATAALQTRRSAMTSMNVRQAMLAVTPTLLAPT
eukprot:CAMPEP_0175967398 /NCGR_PEP_ID=MMETSP0108-20121206/39276_1 /TAXON_ID=195067 ORGANISM="Goniomonas pacifica, Strain CCMP1869" /NCGR_SAMPLE_ID=MMETSP0108 /ASSEMBLY_ACC=CAM_ASM_000204 /LENGTH=86 /DNA_ID=CAMNT_0017295849 /DNA_START=130 /DNA_END=386 /DNA_ORIENTATION=+